MSNVSKGGRRAKQDKILNSGVSMHGTFYRLVSMLILRSFCAFAIFANVIWNNLAGLRAKTGNIWASGIHVGIKCTKVTFDL